MQSVTTSQLNLGTDPKAGCIHLNVADSMRLLVITAMIALSLPLQGGGDGAGEWIVANLDRIVIPTVDCEDASVEEIIDFARLRSSELDPESAKGPTGVSFIICRPKNREGDPVPALTKEKDPGARQINYIAKNVTLTKLLIEIGRQAHLDVHVTDVGIIMCTPGHPPFPNAMAQKGEITKTLYRVPQPTEPEDKANKKR